MLPAEENQQRTSVRKIALGCLCIAAMLAAALLILGRNARKPLIEVERTALISKQGKLYLKNSDLSFSGVMLDHYPTGQIQSRSILVAGVLDGLSQGYYTNGQLQVEEHFKAGTSHGLRTKWY